MGMSSPSEETNQEIARSALLELGLLPERFLKRSPSSLSIGEARRLALASLLSRDPEALLLDEPTSGLDGDGVTRVLRFLRKQRDNRTTMIIVSRSDLLAEVVSGSWPSRRGRLADRRLRYSADGTACDDMDMIFRRLFGFQGKLGERDC
jgi:energy-coupling factor transporter ATP-binding protein EcfA2